jgi:leucyl-tRNA synthetase
MEIDADTINNPWCPDCGTPLEQIDTRDGNEAWACPVAVKGKMLKRIGLPESKHQDAWVYEARAWVEGH